MLTSLLFAYSTKGLANNDRTLWGWMRSDETSRSATDARLLGLEAERALASQAGDRTGDWVTSDPDCASERLFRNYTPHRMRVIGHEHSGVEQMAGTPATPAPRHVRAAEEFMRANAGEPLTLAEIADAAGVSIRTLTAGFRNFRDQSPMQQLRDIRMAAARNDLMQGPGTGSVADIALRWGFGNFGRFAGDYRRRYGETPSETLRRR